MKKHLLLALLIVLVAVAGFGQRYVVTQKSVTAFPGLWVQNGGTVRLYESKANGTNYTALGTDATLAANSTFSTPLLITPGTGTGVTLNDQGKLSDTIFKITVARTNFVANAVTADVTLGTLPAKTVVKRILADVTQTFACTATCTSATLSMVVGKTAGGNEYLASFDIDAATAVFGDAVGEAGASLLGGTTPNVFDEDIPSWSANTTLQARLTSGTGNIGNGTATNLSQGSVTFYVIASRLP